MRYVICTSRRFVAHDKGDRPPSLKGRRPVITSLEMFLWRNYLIFTSCTAPPSSVTSDSSALDSSVRSQPQLSARDLFHKVSQFMLRAAPMGQTDRLHLMRIVPFSHGSDRLHLMRIVPFSHGSDRQAAPHEDCSLLHNEHCFSAVPYTCIACAGEGLGARLYCKTFFLLCPGGASVAY